MYYNMEKNTVQVSYMPKYGKPIWQWALDAARELETDTFAPIDIIRKVHEQNPRSQQVPLDHTS